MEVYQTINLILKEKKLSKKDFTTKLQELLQSDSSITIKIPSEKSIYAYLNGKVSIKIELLPYISQVLDVPIEFLFSDDNNTKIALFKYIFKTELKPYELEYILKKLKIDTALYSTISAKQDIYKDIYNLLNYAPEQFLLKVQDTLNSYKKLTTDFISK